MSRYIKNPYYKQKPEWDSERFAFLSGNTALEFHRSMPGYAPTPLRRLSSIEQSLGIKEVWVKDESERFGIKSFKALGAGYGIYCFLKKIWEEREGTPYTPKMFYDPEIMKSLGSFTFCSASSGNHGKALAWASKMISMRVIIYMPADSVKARVDNIQSENAQVILVRGTYDDCVGQCARDALENGWHIISDIAYEDYEDVPGYIMQGYMTLFNEIEEDCFDTVFLQAGVGALAGVGTAYFTLRDANKLPHLVCVEADDADCYLESIRHGEIEAIPTHGETQSIMAGLNCGIPSTLAWPIIRGGMDSFMSIPNRYVKTAMREYAQNGIVSGESGAAGLAALIALCRDKDYATLRRYIAPGKDSKILLINTEGDTNPENYYKIVGKTATQVIESLR